MNIFSIVGGVWMAFLSLLGFIHQQPQPPQNALVPVQNEQQVPRAAPQSSGAAQQMQPTQTPISSNSSATTMTASLPATGSAWLTNVPLGDGKYTTSGAKQGYIYICHVGSGGGGAQGTPTWISGTTWYPAQKVSVQGSVSWQSAAYAMQVSGSTRTITANGLPTDHPTGTFPISANDPAHQFDANPNSIKAQSYTFSLPASPALASSPNCIYGQVGIMLDGVPLFDGFDAEYRDAVAHETQDAWEGHPDQTGEYHYHGFEKNYVQEPVSTVVGFAFDGFPITGSKLPDGTYLTSSQLDECHGLTSAVTLDGKTVTTYHYVLTQDFPYSVSCFRGKSYEPKPGGTGSQPSGSQMQQMPPPGQRPPPPQY